MSDMKCPICGGELKHETTTGIYCCKRIFADCPLGLGTGAFGTKELWQELIRTRKALDIAVDVAKEIDELLSSNRFDVKEVPLLNITQAKISLLLKFINIEQITALEQKE